MKDKRERNISTIVRRYTKASTIIYAGIHVLRYYNNIKDMNGLSTSAFIALSLVIIFETNIRVNGVAYKHF